MACFHFLIAGLLATTAAQAECGVRNTSLHTADGPAFKVVAAGEGSAKVNGISLGRFVLRGTVNGRPYVIETQKMQGSSATTVSYAGRPAAAFGAPRWFSPSAGLSYDDGETIQVYGGPLDGAWTFACP